MKENRFDPFEKFNSQWAIVTAGTRENFNGMTVSWGSMGTIWGKSVITVYIRPDRYTWRYMDGSDTFTVSFYPEERRKALLTMGQLSGRDGDKVRAAGLTPRFLDNGVTFAEAEETYVCRKIYMAPLDADAIPEEAKSIYRNGVKPHYLIMGEVIGLV